MYLFSPGLQMKIDFEEDEPTIFFLYWLYDILMSVANKMVVNSFHLLAYSHDVLSHLKFFK